jgi:UDP-GlcNAc3NAcA epimerase
MALHNGCADCPSEIINEVVIHTGQHYDYQMSGVFFEALGLEAPKYNLEAGSGSHGTQLATMLERLEDVLKEEAPNFVLVYGDTNSTLAGSLMADRLNIPVAHVEAGLRSFNRRMAEESNRIITDRLSTLLFAPTDSAVRNLAREGITEGVYQVGDVMHEAAMFHSKGADCDSAILQKLSLTKERYSLATIHRAANTDDPVRLRSIVEGLVDVSDLQTVVWPMHPRARKQLLTLQTADLALDRLMITDPVPYHDMLLLEQNARVILTDSGGVQKEAFWFGVPCVTLRDETEWIETLEKGRNELAGCDRGRILNAFKSALRKLRMPVQTEENGIGPSALIVRHLCGFGAVKTKASGFSV